MKTNASALYYPKCDTIINSFMCPSDQLNPKTKTWNPGGGTGNSQGFHGNYIVCVGNDYFNPGGGATSSAQLNGVFYAQSKTRVGDIKDGTSQTLLLSELILSADAVDNDIRGRYYNPAHGGVLFTTLEPPNSPRPDEISWSSTKNDVSQAPLAEQGENGFYFLTARSYHVGVVNLARADGSVAAVSESTNGFCLQRSGGDLSYGRASRFGGATPDPDVIAQAIAGCGSQVIRTLPRSKTTASTSRGPRSLSGRSVEPARAGSDSRDSDAEAMP
jgi:hypothetical protein